MSVRRVIIISLVWGGLAGTWLLTGEPREKPTWSRDLGGKIIGVVNAGPGMYSALPSPRDLPLAQGTMGYVPSYGQISFKDVCEGYKRGAVRILEAPSGVLVLIVEDRDDAVRLVALDTETGAVRWELGGFSFGGRGGCLALGDLALLRLERDAQGKPPEGKNLWAAVDLRDGHLLWRNTDVKGEWADLLCLPEQRLVLIRACSFGLGGGDGGSLSAIQLDTGRTRWQAALEYPWELRPPRVEAAPSPWIVFPPPVYQSPDNFLAGTAGRNDLALAGIKGKSMASVVQSRNLETGQLRWEYPVDKETHAAALAVSGDSVYAFCFETIAVLDRATGALRAAWPVPNEKNERLGKGGPGQPRFLRLDGDWLFVHCPGGKKYQLKAFDVKSGRHLWEATQFREALDSFVVAGDRLVLGSARSVTVMDKRTGAVTGTFDLRFERKPGMLAATGAGRIVVQSENQLAAFQADPWKAVFDTGAMPKTEAALPAREAAGGPGILDVIGALPAFGVAGMASTAERIINERQRARKLDATRPPGASAPAGQPAATRPGGGDTATHDPAETIRILVDLADGLAARSEASTGEDAAFFLMEAPSGGKQLLRVGLDTGERRPARLCDPGEWRNTVVDDAHGINCQVGKDAVSGYRYDLPEARRQRVKFLDPLATGAGSLARADELKKTHRLEESAEAWTRGEQRLRAALAAASSVDEQAAARLYLAAAYLSQMQPGAGAAPGLKEKLHAELAAVAGLPVPDGDEWLRAAVDFAAAASRKDQ